MNSILFQSDRTCIPIESDLFSLSFKDPTGNKKMKPGDDTINNLHSLPRCSAKGKSFRVQGFHGIPDVVTLLDFMFLWIPLFYE